MNKKFKRALGVGTIAFASVALLAACGSKSNSSDGKTVNDLKVAFIPSAQQTKISGTDKLLPGILKKELKKQGYDVKKIDISLGTSYEAVGQALKTGSADVGYGVPQGTIAEYSTGLEPILTATRKGMSNDSEDAAAWNANKPTKRTDKEVTAYRSIILVGNSKVGKELAADVKAGKKIPWSDLNNAKWGLSDPTSSAGYLYPSVWLTDHYKKSVKDLKNTVRLTGGYADGITKLATGQIDVLPVYGDARMDMANVWAKSGVKGSVWDDTNVIAVTPNIYNDGIVVSKNSKVMTPAFKKALQNAIIDMTKTSEGKKIINIYQHDGYKKANAANYKDAKKILDEVNNS